MIKFLNMLLANNDNTENIVDDSHYICHIFRSLENISIFINEKSSFPESQLQLAVKDSIEQSRRYFEWNQHVSNLSLYLISFICY